MSEKRTTTRRRALKGAQIVFGDPPRVLDCTIRNRSDTGAQITVASVVGIPDQFELRETATGLHRPVTVIWRQVNLLGVRFD